MPHNSYHLTLIGCGNMGGALLRGWLSAGIIASAAVLEPSGAPSGFAAASNIEFYTDTAALVAARPATDVIVLAVKPQILAEACAAIAPAVPRRALVLSIAAGKTLAAVGAAFCAGQPLIRAMPNTPAAIGKGITGLVAGQDATLAHRAMAEALLLTAGAVEWLEDEALLDPLTAISGSGPAYVFYFIEALAEAGVKLGLPPDIAMRLARQTIIGSAALAEADGSVAAETLRRNVTSPNGTTQAALDVLMDGRWQDILKEATAAAARRSKELSA